jgi:hypothetical protein
VDATPPARVHAVEPEALAQDAHGLEAQLTCKAAKRVLFFLDQVGARLGVLTRRERRTHRPDAAADAIARLDDGDGGASRLEVACGGQAGKARASNDNGGPSEASRRHR